MGRLYTLSISLVVAWLISFTDAIQLSTFQFNVEPENVVGFKDSSLTLNCSATCDCGQVSQTGITRVEST